PWPSPTADTCSKAGASSWPAGAPTSSPTCASSVPTWGSTAGPPPASSGPREGSTRRWPALGRARLDARGAAVVVNGYGGSGQDGRRAGRAPSVQRGPVSAMTQDRTRRSGLGRREMLGLLGAGVAV